MMDPVLIEAEPDQNKYYSFSVDKMSSATISFTLEEPASGDHVIIDIYDENGFLNNDSLLSCELNTSTCEDVEYITNMNEEEARYYLAIRGNANIHIRKNEEKFEGIDPSTNKESIPLFLPIVIITGFILMIAFIAIIAFIILHLRKRK